MHQHFDDFVCLQLLQHASGSERYLRVSTNETTWAISDNIDDGGESWILSGPAGGVCPAQKSKSGKGWTSWQNVDADKDGWVEWADWVIKLTPSTHSGAYD